MLHALKVENIEKDKVYSRQQMISLLRENSPGYTINSCQWKLGEMLRAGEIIKIGYDQYMLGNVKIRPVYLPDYSELAGTVMEQIIVKYPYMVQVSKVI